tara:strand:+ start:54 stop:272 length:219 start_codon:yes stop_codon:yes gene_type:complete
MNTINTPNKLPNKSENSKLLTGINICNISKIIESKIKYIIKKFNFIDFLYVKKPIIDSKQKAYKWLEETKKS